MARRALVRGSVVVLGLLVIAIGLIAWALESEYGAEPDLLVAEEGTDGVVRLYEVDDPSSGPEDDPDATPVFEGTGEQAREWTARRRDEQTNHLVPGAIIAFGVVLAIAAFVPVRRTPTSSGSRRRTTNGRASGPDHVGARRSRPLRWRSTVDRADHQRSIVAVILS